MTATSSLPFATMEVPTEDSMEMASPYDRPADDFDIDIDLMEENVANMDSDMMGADDPPNTTQPSLFQNDLTDDADMADESLEGSMVDDENIIDEDYDVDIHLDETYETEMLEDDQTETIDVAPPSISIDVSETTEGQAGPTQDLPVEEPVDIAIEESIQEESIQETPAVSDTPLPESLAENGGHGPMAQDHDLSVESHAVESIAPENPQENETAQPINHDDVGPANTNQATENNLSQAEEQNAPSSLSAENLDASDVKSSHEIADELAKNAETPSVHETEDHGADDEPLHPVKVLYQDNEISLFPPFEGDSAETFFLHDDSVAYDSFGKLFGSLRGVLLDNIAGNEVLVIDIDALGIQLTEDSSYTSKITLHQVLSIYLRLCYNDGTHEPEALYLTLSSRLAVDSELASLDAAANEGKGLSQLDPWDDLDEADVKNGEILIKGEAAHSGEEPSRGESQHNTPSHEATPGPEEQTSLSDQFEDEHAEQYPGGAYESLPEDQASKPELASSDPQDELETNQTEECNPTEASEILHAHRDKDNFGSEPGTASTSTVAPNDQPHDVPTDVEDTADHPNLDGSADQAAISHGDDAFAEEDFTAQDEADEEEPEFQEELPNKDETHVHSDPTAALEDKADPTDVSQHDTNQTSYDQAESAGQEVVQDTYPPNDQTPEPEDDLFGIAEDLMQSPAKDRQKDMSETLEGETQDEFAEDDLAGSVNVESAGDHQLDDGDLEDWYPEFEVTEATELGETDLSLTDSQSHDNPSAKRSREGDEEWDLTDATTPDTKRRRS